MLTVIDSSDIQFHYNLLKQAKVIPDMAKLDGVSFERGGSIVVDGAIDLPAPLGGFDVKIHLIAKLLSDLKTIRLRVQDVKVSGFGTRGLVMKVVKQIVENITVPGLRFVADGDDGYIEYRRPQYWIWLKDIQTDGKLTIVVQGFDIPAAMKEFQAVARKAMETSGSMADQARLASTGNHGVGTGTETPTIHKAPNVTGAVNITKPI